jgi:hypothetical protein
MIDYTRTRRKARNKVNLIQARSVVEGWKWVSIMLEVDTGIEIGGENTAKTPTGHPIHTGEIYTTP